MRILEYANLDTAGVTDEYQRATEAIARSDFRAADVKKLTGHHRLYRAKLGGADRLIFTLLRCRDEVCALMLEVVRNHDYGKSRFLRGATIDESRITDSGAAGATADALPVRYVHPERVTVHYLDKPLSFDDAQDEIYRLAPPLIIVGGAGSGKTALALEKLKAASGEVLYVTQSAYLARNARDLYYGSGYEREEQDSAFLSYRELVESLRVPSGREVTWREFSAWFARMRQSFRGIEAHQAFEEIRGVIAAQASGILSRDQYRALGVRQSIFAEADRDRLYDLFEKYRVWLVEAKLFDAGLLAHEWLALAAPRYDFVVVDEVQDLTAAQLTLPLKLLKTPGHFLLCGDSNQIVHPNFFAWSRVKSLFWSDPDLAARQQLHVLSANFRNGHEITRLANSLLKAKHRRFGSIDRESNFLVQSVGGAAGQVALLADREPDKRELDAKIRGSTQFAVLVVREEDKAEAKRWFSTPLLFSVQEAKGLEYENIVLYRFVSDYRREFTEIVQGVASEDLATDSLEYARSRDKTDKSLEIYKFFVNALYVALTRAVQNLVLIESDVEHPLFALLGLGVSGAFNVAAHHASLEEWQREARKLELQGKQEQVEAIRRTILKEVPPPWQVFDEAQVRETLRKVFVDKTPGDKKKQRLFEWAAVHDEPMIAVWLADEANYGAAHGFRQSRGAVARKHFTRYAASYFKDILHECELHGSEHRTQANLTPLMAASASGNVRLVEALLERGASPETTDHYGRNALHWAMLSAFHDQKFARGPFPVLYERVGPSSIDVKAGERLVRIDKRLAEYFLFQTLWALFKGRFTHPHRKLDAAFDTNSILGAWQHLPASVVRPERNRRQHVSSVLARNEIARDYAYNRALFVRVSHGSYQFNPLLELRCRHADEEFWRPIYSVLNLPLVGEFALPILHPRLEQLISMAGLPKQSLAFGAEREATRQQRERAESEARTAKAIALAAQARQLARTGWDDPDPDVSVEPKWGTSEAREREMERLQRRIDALRQSRSKDPGG